VDNAVPVPGIAPATALNAAYVTSSSQALEQILAQIPENVEADGH